MNYIKPEITMLASASVTIQGQSKALFTGNDSLQSPWQTMGAYESDE